MIYLFYLFIYFTDMMLAQTLGKGSSKMISSIDSPLYKEGCINVDSIFYQLGHRNVMIKV